jgi:Uma2 family endonuclease
MRTVREIVLPETKPETEWIGDRPVQKVSPTRKHGLLQLAFAEALKAWAKAGNRGQVVTEWRFRASPPGEDIHPLVPDVAYMSYERLRPLSPKDREVPSVAPEIVVEISSPDDRQRDIIEKRRVYFAWGVLLELIADPEARTLDVYDRTGFHERIGADREAYSPAIIPNLALPVRATFAEIDIPDELSALPPMESAPAKIFLGDTAKGGITHFTNVVKPERAGVMYRCPCCRHKTLADRGGHTICSVCFWHDDGQDDHDADEIRAGPNYGLSLTHARRNFAEYGAVARRVLRFVRPPTEAESEGG